MRIVSLEPVFTELVAYFGLGEQLVGISHRCDYPAEITNLPRVTAARATGSSFSATGAVSVSALAALNPQLVLCSPPSQPEARPTRAALSAALNKDLKDLAAPLKVEPFWPGSLSETLTMFEDLGAVLSVGEQGRRLAARIKAQLMDWADNFYPRIKNKRVIVLRSLAPLAIAGAWVTEALSTISAHPMPALSTLEKSAVQWSDLLEFRPDVILVALEDLALPAVMASFKELEQLEGWESIPAVKRGEVSFAAGVDFMRPAGRLLDSIAILVSAVAGFESGYITPRDTFYRLRWLELQRHRI